MAIQANYYLVQVDQSSGSPLLCTRRARLKKMGQKVMVGDRVGLEEIDLVANQAAIASVEPRKTELSRPPVANAEQILLVFSLVEPPLEVWQLSRFLVKAESTALTLRLCLNKADLLTDAEIESWQARLGHWGYSPITVSTLTQSGLSLLQDQLRHKITLLAGPSGVGKSSLINLLVPDRTQRVKQVSGKLQKGRHTTRHVELFALPTGGLIADTPGFNQPDLDLLPEEVIHCFPEARPQLEQGTCYFKDCLHRGEPHCVISSDWERYEHYLTFLAEALEQQQYRSSLHSEDTGMKLKIGEAGERSYEPKLESKKYRRQSRRTKHQHLHSFYNDHDFKNRSQGSDSENHD